jgi:hypothetical protein
MGCDSLSHGHLNSPALLLPTLIKWEGGDCRGTTSVVFVVDKSASAHGPLIDSEKEILRQVIKKLPSTYSVGVVAFDNTLFILNRLSPLTSEFRSQVLDRLERLFPAQKSNVLPAVEEARRQLINSPDDCRHIMVLSDGLMSDLGPAVPKYIEHLHETGIRTSFAFYTTMKIDASLEKAQYNSGGFYIETSDPSLFVKSTVSYILSTLKVSEIP